MIKTLIALMIVSTFVSAKIETVDVTPEILSRYTQIIDVRTPDEWRETGVVKGAFNIDIAGNKRKFVKDILDRIDHNEPVALICRNGRRSAYVANFLEEELLNQDIKLEIVNLNGGINSLIKQGYNTVSYNE